MITRINVNTAKTAQAGANDESSLVQKLGPSCSKAD